MTRKLKVNLKKILDWGRDGFVLVSTIGPIPARAGCDCHHDQAVTQVFETVVLTCDAVGWTDHSSRVEHVAHFDTEALAMAHHETLLQTALEEGAKLSDVPHIPWNLNGPEVRA